MLIEIHMLKNYAPTNLNRDDNGSPKSCVFGGVPRGRISSQCLKRSWRNSDYLKSKIHESSFGIRTRKLPLLVGEELSKKGIDTEYIEIAKEVLSGIGKKEKEKEKEKEKVDGKGKKTGITSQIIFYSPEDIKAISEWMYEKINKCKNKTEIKKLSIREMETELKNNTRNSVTVDMALFGRMVTSDMFKDVEAAMQVASAISTNKVFMENDFFTAVDDIISGEDRGSAMMDDMYYNSSCYYIYGSLDTDKLRENLKETEGCDEIVNDLLPVLIQTMAYTNPSGKQNTFAGHSLPSAVLVECKNMKIPVSYANAFESPAYAGKDGSLVQCSIKKLKTEIEKINHVYGIPVEKRLWLSVDDDIKLDESVGENYDSFQELINALPKL